MLTYILLYFDKYKVFFITNKLCELFNCIKNPITFQQSNICRKSCFYSLIKRKVLLKAIACLVKLTVNKLCRFQLTTALNVIRETVDKRLSRFDIV